jgi:hypothetical protein
MPIPKSDYDVIRDVPQWLLKKMAKIEPSPVVGGEGEGVYYIGRFSDVWAPEDLRNREFYYLHARTVLSPSLKTEEVKQQCLGGTDVNDGDPLFPSFASALSLIFFLNVCGPTGTTTWSSCLDPQFESAGAGCYPSGTISSYDYSKCYTTGYAPSMFIFSAAPSSDQDLTNLTAFSRPCPVYSSTPALSGKTETSGKVLIRAVGCDDSSNRVRYVRYTSEDRSTASYTISYLGIGMIISSSLIQIYTRYGLSSSVTKGSTDYYYYIYTIGFQYA